MRYKNIRPEQPTLHDILQKKKHSMWNFQNILPNKKWTFSPNVMAFEHISKININNLGLHATILESSWVGVAFTKIRSQKKNCVKTVNIWDQIKIGDYSCDVVLLRDQHYPILLHWSIYYTNIIFFRCPWNRQKSNSMLMLIINIFKIKKILLFPQPNFYFFFF